MLYEMMMDCCAALRWVERLVCAKGGHFPFDDCNMRRFQRRTPVTVAHLWHTLSLSQAKHFQVSTGNNHG